MNPHRLVSAAAIIVAGLAVASPALAHIDPDPTEGQAGSEQFDAYIAGLRSRSKVEINKANLEKKSQ